MFVGRKRELATLNSLYERGGFQMVVVYGRRRVGKTALINEFARGKRALSFTALEQGDAANLADFSRKIAEFFNLPASMGPFSTWLDAFDYVADQAAREPFVFIFDELPYAAQRGESVPSALQIAIDRKLQNTDAFLILCGSDQGFMESDVLGRKSPLYGRRTAQIKLGPLGYREAAEMLPGLDPQEQFRFYGCFGGVPYYLRQVDPAKSLRENLAGLYFDPTGFLFDEPYGLLRQELSEPALYAGALRAIASGATKSKEIAEKAGMEPTGVTRYLRTLERLGIVERSVPFGENPQTSKRSSYKIADACFDFWFRFVMPAVSDIEGGLGSVVASRLPEQQLSDYLGHRFERLCAEWLLGQAAEGLLPIAASAVGSWWGPNPAKRQQDDIDVLAADREQKLLLIGECKYRESFDETAEIDDLDSKRDLVRGYHASHLYLFSKRAVSEATAEKCAHRPDVHLVTLEELYAL